MEIYDTIASIISKNSLSPFKFFNIRSKIHICPLFNGFYFYSAELLFTLMR
jgi:hypothetical protein